MRKTTAMDQRYYDTATLIAECIHYAGAYRLDDEGREAGDIIRLERLDHMYYNVWLIEPRDAEAD